MTTVAPAARSTGAATGAPVAIGAIAPIDHADLLVEAAAFTPRVLADIADPTVTSIDVEMFAWHADGNGLQIADALMARAKGGTPVRVMVDGLGSRQVPGTKMHALVQKMRDAGVDVRVGWNLGLRNHRLQGVDHRKLFLFNRGERTYTGGMNLGKVYDTWHDSMVRVVGPSGARAQQAYDQRWMQLTGDGTGGALDGVAALGKHAAPTTKGAVQGAVLLEPKHLADTRVEFDVNDPIAGTFDATAGFRDAVLAARRRVWVHAGFIGSQDAVDLLVRAKRNGADVRIIVAGPNKFKNGRFAVPYTRTYLPTLLDSGVRVYHFDGMLHSKGWIADDIAGISTKNQDVMSERISHEIQARLHGGAAVTDVAEMFTSDFARSRELGVAEITKLDRVAEFVRRGLHLNF